MAVETLCRFNPFFATQGASLHEQLQSFLQLITVVLLRVGSITLLSRLVLPSLLFLQGIDLLPF